MGASVTWPLVVKFFYGHPFRVNSPELIHGISSLLNKSCNPLKFSSLHTYLLYITIRQIAKLKETTPIIFRSYFFRYHSVINLASRLIIFLSLLFFSPFHFANAVLLISSFTIQCKPLDTRPSYRTTPIRIAHVPHFFAILGDALP